jgi:excisionase family DNA binding protein
MITYLLLDEPYVKIGKTKCVQGRWNPSRDNTTCVTDNPRSLTLLGEIVGDVERLLHTQFKHLHVRGEWFHDSPEIRAAFKQEVSVRESREDREARKSQERQMRVAQKREARERLELKAEQERQEQERQEQERQEQKNRLEAVSRLNRARKAEQERQARKAEQERQEPRLVEKVSHIRSLPALCVDVPQAARMLGVSENTVRAFIAGNKLPKMAATRGRRILVSVSALEAFVAERS